MKTILSTLLVLMLAGGAAAWGGWQLYEGFLATPVALEEQAVLEIPDGATIRSVAHELADRGWIPSRFLFTLHAYETERQNALKAGEYAIEPGMRPGDLLALFASGKSIQFPVTIVPGTRFRDAIKTIAEAGVFDVQLRNLSDAEIMERLGIDAEHPEGWLYPDTYLYRRGTSDVEILTRAHKRMQAVLAEEWAARGDDLPIDSPYEALILASIVEKETGKAAERPRIAGVFARRLQQGMKLQTDPTVIYGLGDAYQGNITREHLRQATPYNTYVIPALPPTPIALPAREAIHAVLHPADGDEIFFVARGDGSHYFSATYEEHNCAVQHYQLKKPCANLRDEEAKQAKDAEDTEDAEATGEEAGATAAADA
jgi:UPF0755 protein